MSPQRLSRILTLALAAAAVCGGTHAARREPTLAERISAAQSTATHNAYCQAITPFYWAIGDATGMRADGREGMLAPGANTVMAIASASKLIDGAYVVERFSGVIGKQTASFLNFTSGYTEFGRCLPEQTVAECQSYHRWPIDNGGYVAEHKGKFFYSGGHMQKQAVQLGLGPDDNAALAAHINATLGGTAFEYLQPQLAGGVQTSAAGYGRLLQKIVGGELKIKGLLGCHAVCTNPDTCPTALATPIPRDESWHYSLGHWVEDDPAVGDSAFSSAGAFGFYPWIDAKKRWWGVIARESSDGLGSDDPHLHPGARSMFCGRQIRAAWIDGIPR